MFSWLGQKREDRACAATQLDDLFSTRGVSAFEAAACFPTATGSAEQQTIDLRYESHVL